MDTHLRSILKASTYRASWDLMPIVHLLNQQILSQKFLFNLPRKFKISFSACSKACAKPWINDLGFIAQQDGTFTLIGAGSLGPKPNQFLKEKRENKNDT